MAMVTTSTTPVSSFTGQYADLVESAPTSQAITGQVSKLPLFDDEAARKMPSTLALQTTNALKQTSELWFPYQTMDEMEGGLAWIQSTTSRKATSNKPAAATFSQVPVSKSVENAPLDDVNNVSEVLEKFFNNSRGYALKIQDGSLTLVQLSWSQFLLSLFGVEFTNWDDVITHANTVIDGSRFWEMREETIQEVKFDRLKAQIQRLVQEQFIKLRDSLSYDSAEKLTDAAGWFCHKLSIEDVLSARIDAVNFSRFIYSLPNSEAWKNWMILAERYNKSSAFTLLTTKELTKGAVKEQKKDPSLVLIVEKTARGEKYLATRQLTAFESVEEWMQHSPICGVVPRIQEWFHHGFFRSEYVAQCTCEQSSMKTYVEGNVQSPEVYSIIKFFNTKTSYSKTDLKYMSQEAIRLHRRNPLAYVLTAKFDSDGREYLVAEPVDKLPIAQSFLYKRGLDVSTESARVNRLVAIYTQNQ